MTGLSDAAIQRLRSAAGRPALESSRYEIVREIGRGGMGAVYLAVDRELGREVAVKVPLDADSAALEARLRTEARALARLEHPGIVPIHDFGRLADGRLFYVMKCVRGRTLRDYLQEQSDLTARLGIFERICEPVAFAHAEGCIHRDLKPDNIMIGPFGEVLIMDWGVARVAGVADTDRAGPERTFAASTAPGTIVGTRGFMAPEQAAASPGVDHRADVYSLGAILYLMLMGEEPAEPADVPRTIGRTRKVPRPLRSICIRALAGDPDHRYPAVAALGEDVARFRAGRAVEAHRENPMERTVRFVRTYQVPILLVLAYVIMRALVAFIARQ